MKNGKKMAKIHHAKKNIFFGPKNSSWGYGNKMAFFQKNIDFTM